VTSSTFSNRSAVEMPEFESHLVCGLRSSAKDIVDARFDAIAKCAAQPVAILYGRCGRSGPLWQNINQRRTELSRMSNFDQTATAETPKAAQQRCRTGLCKGR
jgi:hypothetical protein